MEKIQSTELLKTKPHYEVLDGLRGIAALAIVVFHFMEWIYTPEKNFIGHGFLAVDFFFCLSGFVIPYAYDNRMGIMKKKDFFIGRIIRLHPMVVMGAVLGLLAFLFDPFEAVPATYTPVKIAILFLMSALLIPYPVMEDRFFNNFGLNAPAWSLFWEYIINIVYALFLWRIKKPLHIVLLILAAGLLTYIAYTSGNLLGGWNGETFWHGGVRILYSFLAGMLIYRFNFIIKNKMGFLPLMVMLCAAFVAPVINANWLVELLLIALWFPLIVSLGAGMVVEGRTKDFCRLSGNISYPLYMSHYAVMWIFGHYFTKYNPPMDQLKWIIIGGVILLVLFAWIIMVAYDIPVRKWLQKKWLNRNAD